MSERHVDSPATSSLGHSLCAGELQSVDGYMNIALEKTVELVDDGKGQRRRVYGDAFIRGNNGKYTPVGAAFTHISALLMSQQSCTFRPTPRGAPQADDGELGARRGAARRPGL